MAERNYLERTRSTQRGNRLSPSGARSASSGNDMPTPEGPCSRGAGWRSIDRLIAVRHQFIPPRAGANCDTSGPDRSNRRNGALAAGGCRPAPGLPRPGFRCRCGRCTACISSSRRRRCVFANCTGTPEHGLRPMQASSLTSTIPCFALVGCARRAYGHAGRIFAVQQDRDTRAAGRALACLEGVDTVEPDAIGIGPVGMVRQRGR